MRYLLKESRLSRSSEKYGDPSDAEVDKGYKAAGVVDDKGSLFVLS